MHWFLFHFVQYVPCACSCACTTSLSLVPLYSGDVYGCRYNLRHGTVSFTKNGKALGRAFAGVCGRLFAAVCLPVQGTKVRVNFGMPYLCFVDSSCIHHCALFSRRKSKCLWLVMTSCCPCIEMRVFDLHRFIVVLFVHKSEPLMLVLSLHGIAFLSVCVLALEHEYDLIAILTCPCNVVSNRPRAVCV